MGRRYFTFMLVLASLAVPVARATTVPRQSLEDLVSGSGRVVHGRVLRHWVDWDKSHQFIWTHYSVQVFDMVKGTASQNFVISEAGGFKDGMTMAAPGTVEYTDGEEVVAFLHSTPIGYWRTLGYSQGKFSIRDSRVFNAESRTMLVDLPGAPAGKRTSLSSVSGKPVETFKALIRDLMRRGAAK
jgi:hypothetical protein